jgi:Peptidase family M1 domain/Secretion system C-terminal sorting domain
VNKLFIKSVRPAIEAGGTGLFTLCDSGKGLVTTVIAFLPRTVLLISSQLIASIITTYNKSDHNIDFPINAKRLCSLVFMPEIFLILQSYVIVTSFKKILALQKYICMRALLFIASILLITNQLTYAQESPATWQCSMLKSHSAAKETVANPAEENYDIKYVKFNLKLTNATTYVSGDVTTKAVAVVPGFSSYVFELDDSLVIDQVLVDGAPLPYTSAGDVRTVALASPLLAGTMFTVQVFYHGMPSTASTIFGGIGGINSMNSPTWGARVTFTQSESYHAKEWWPCKQSLHDKIDSVDMWITVADSLKAGSNGILKAVTTIDADHVRYEWSERHPIDYYLISASVARYIDYSYYMHFTGSTDSMLVQNYVYRNPFTLLLFKTTIDSTGLMIDYFSKLYSRYPFWDEKYGHCMAPLSGGMEHQTMTTLGYFEGTVVAHELGHQWFGDNVTCSTWADIFANEGFASYTEDLFIEHFRSQAQMVNDMVRKQKDVRSVDTGSIYARDTADEARIFDSRLSYEKGACMLHMLRFVVGDDSTFFHIYKSYQQEHKNSNGTIMDFNTAAKSVMGIYANGTNLDTFFNQWAYKQGFPIYAPTWNQVGNDVYVQLDQKTAMPSSVGLFKMPIEIRLHSTAGDTTIRVINDQPGQQYHFTWRKTMSGIVLDPNHWLLDSVGVVKHDTLLSVQQVAKTDVKIYPNPTRTSWQIEALPAYSTLMLMDITGRVLWQKSAQGTTETVPASELAPGLYLLRIIKGEGVNSAYKLIKE